MDGWNGNGPIIDMLSFHDLHRQIIHANPHHNQEINTYKSGRYRFWGALQHTHDGRLLWSETSEHKGFFFSIVFKALLIIHSDCQGVMCHLLFQAPTNGPLIIPRYEIQTKNISEKLHLFYHGEELVGLPIQVCSSSQLSQSAFACCMTRVYSLLLLLSWSESCRYFSSKFECLKRTFFLETEGQDL